jgi:hypothetical protein
MELDGDDPASGTRERDRQRTVAGAEVDHDVPRTDR